MTQLFVANLKRQVEHFTFRLPGAEKVQQYPIQPASQLKIPLALTDEQIDSIVQQKAMYGMVPAKAVIKSPFFHGICFSLDKPVTNVEIDRGFEHNDEALMKEAEDQRVTATAATAAQMEEQTNGTLREFRQEIMEIPAAGADQNNVLNHTIEVARDGDTASARRNRKPV